MDYSKLIIPGLVFALQFTMKLVVGRGFEGKTTVQSICELPVGLIFLSISFSLLYILTSQTDINHIGLITFILFVILALLITAISRHTINLNDSKKSATSLFLLVFINLALSISCIYHSTGFMVEKLQNDQTINTLQNQKPTNVK